MTNKFDNVPVEEGTVLLLSFEAKFGDYDTRYEKWSWDNIHAETLIFLNDDIKNVTQETLKKEILESPLVEEGSRITVKKSDAYTFFNFNFKSSDD